MLKVIAFDVFGTVFDLSSVDRDEIRDYAAHLRAFRETGEWKPLVLPKSWETLPAHADSEPGIAELRDRYLVVTMSNGPLGLLAKLSHHNGISWDAIIPLEMKQTYKPNPAAYLTICEVLGVEPHEVAMITANPTFGDVEASQSLGMTPIVIRGESKIQTIIDLAEALK